MTTPAPLPCVFTFFSVLAAAAPLEFTVAALRVLPERWNKQANLRKLEEWTRKAAAAGAELVIAPEGFLEGYVGNDHQPDIGRGKLDRTKYFEVGEPLDGEALRRVRALAQELKVYLAVGFAEREAERMYNSLLVVSPQGRDLIHYRKTHCGDSEPYNTEGDRLQVADTPLGRWGALICLDRQLPETTRILAVRGAQFILVPAYGSYGEMNELMMRVRAYENSVWVAFVHPRRCLIVDPRGRIVARDAGDADQLVTARVRLDERIGSGPIRFRRPEIYADILQPGEIPQPLTLSAPVSLKVAAVQMRSSFDVEESSRRIIGRLEELAREGVRVAAFPECALTGYDKDALRGAHADRVAAAEEEIRRACRRLGIAAVFGSVYKAGARTYNTAVVFNARGELVERYAKVMLAGEKWATPGNHIALFELEGVPSTVIICHDERYPELVRLPALAGARLVYYISHESGLKEESKLAPYRAQLMARAVENQVFIVAANAPANSDLTGSHGQSRIVNEDGNVLREASFFGEDVLIETLRIRPRRLERPLTGLMGDWWRLGLNLMWAGRDRTLH